uniref:Uncharacterized protein n=1 Tax=Trichogramma kaykai TaxID=54128 RepID=A0ABD2WHA5_9HYME
MLSLLSRDTIIKLGRKLAVVITYPTYLNINTTLSYSSISTHRSKRFAVNIPRIDQRVLNMEHYEDKLIGIN